MHVMSVKMHRVSSGRAVVNHDADGAVGAEVLDVPLCGESQVSLVSLQEDRLVIVRAERGAI